MLGVPVLSLRQIAAALARMRWVTRTATPPKARPPCGAVVNMDLVKEEAWRAAEARHAIPRTVRWSTAGRRRHALRYC